MATSGQQKKDKKTKCVFYCLDVFEPRMLEMRLLNPPDLLTMVQIEKHAIPSISDKTEKLIKDHSKRTEDGQYELVNTVNGTQVYFFAFTSSIKASSLAVTDVIAPRKEGIFCRVSSSTIKKRWIPSSFVPMVEAKKREKELKEQIEKREEETKKREEETKTFFFNCFEIEHCRD